MQTLENVICLLAQSESRWLEIGQNQGFSELSAISPFPSALTAWPIKSLHWICYLGHSAAQPDKLGVCFDFTLGKTSGMEHLAQKPARAQLKPLSEVAYSMQASDWSGSKCRGKERDGGQLVIPLVRIDGESLYLNTLWLYLGYFSIVMTLILCKELQDWSMILFVSFFGLAFFN